MASSGRWSRWRLIASERVVRQPPPTEEREVGGGLSADLGNSASEIGGQTSAAGADFFDDPLTVTLGDHGFRGAMIVADDPLLDDLPMALVVIAMTVIAAIYVHVDAGG